jgi:hypothetical protein
MSLSVINFTTPVMAWESLPSISSTCYIRTYTLKSSGKIYPYKSQSSSQIDYSHYIDCAKDECYITQISGSRVKVSYPTGNTRSVRWFKTSDFFYNGKTYAQDHYWLGGRKVNTYRWQNLKTYYGYVGTSNNTFDEVWIIGNCGDAYQVLYTVDAQYGGGYKLAWGGKNLSW